MDFEKYSKRQFESLELNKSSARKLADELETDVAAEIHASVLESFRKIIEELNQQGHNLKPYGEITAGDISYRDEPEKDRCRLRLSCDFVISAGYADTVDE